MKGIVVEKNNENAVLLLSDGTFKTVKTTDELQIGTITTINITKNAPLFYFKKVAPMIAAVFLVVFFGVGAYSWTKPVQYIGIDINPSLELVLNRFDRIIETKPLNEDGRRLLGTVDIQMKKYDHGIDAVIESAKEMGYLADETDVLISISSSDSNRRQKTQAQIEAKITKAEVLTFDEEEHDMTVSEGVSPGKSRMITKVLESGTNLTEEELVEVPVKELRLRIKENKKIGKELEKEAKQQEKKKDEKAENNKQEKGNKKDSPQDPGHDKPGRGDDELKNHIEEGPDKPDKDKGPEKPGNNKDPLKPDKDKGPEKPGNDKEPEKPGNDKGPEKPRNDKGSDKRGNDKGSDKPADGKGAIRPGNGIKHDEPGTDTKTDTPKESDLTDKGSNKRKENNSTDKKEDKAKSNDDADMDELKSDDSTDKEAIAGKKKDEPKGKGITDKDNDISKGHN